MSLLGVSTIGDVLTIAGALVELAGVIVTAIGFTKTWKEFRAPGDRFIGPIVKSLDRLTLWLGRVFNHKLPQTVSPIGIHDDAGVSDVVAVETRWAPLPSPDENPDEFLRLLNERLTELNRRGWNAEHAIASTKADLSSHRSQVNDEISRLRSDASTTVQRVAVGGLLLSSFGLILLVMGLGLQTAGQLL